VVRIAKELSDKLKGIKNKIGDIRNKLDDIDPKLTSFEDTFNPLQYYCRLRDIGIKKEDAKLIAEQYELLIYSYVQANLKKNEQEKQASDYNI